MLECAHFVHQCNRGQWPSWLKAQLPPFRPSKQGVFGMHPVFGNIGNNTPGAPITVQSVQQRRAIAMQLQASKAFHQWAEVGGILNPYDSSSMHMNLMLMDICYCKYFT